MHGVIEYLWNSYKDSGSSLFTDKTMNSIMLHEEIRKREKEEGEGTFQKEMNGALNQEQTIEHSWIEKRV